MNTYQRIRQLEDAAVQACCGLLDYWVPATPRGFTSILAFHRVGDFPHHPTWNIGVRQFELVLRSMLERGFQPITLDELVREGVTADAQKFVVTFDDGYRSVLTQALPILQRLEIPATVFLVTAAVGQRYPFSFDDWDHRGTGDVCAEASLPLSITECHALRDSGWVQFGSHTHTHADFRNRPQLLARDLERSKAWLQEHLGCGSAIPFAFPYGNRHMGFCDDDVTQVVREAGMSCALTTDPLLVTQATSRFAMGRFLLHPGDRAGSIHGRMNGWYPRLKSRLRQCSQPFRRGESLQFGNEWASEMEPSLTRADLADRTPHDRLAAR